MTNCQNCRKLQDEIAEMASATAGLRSFVEVREAEIRTLLEAHAAELAEAKKWWAEYYKRESERTDELIAMRQRAEAAETELAALRQGGHNMLCYYCKVPINNLAGNPGLWCVMLCHEDEPGVNKPHHSACVMERLQRLEAAEGEAKRARVTAAFEKEHAASNLDRWQAAEAALAEVHMDLHKRKQWLSGILQEWQPRNGK